MGGQEPNLVKPPRWFHTDEPLQTSYEMKMLHTLSTKTVNKVYQLLSANISYVLVAYTLIVHLSCAAGRNGVCKTKTPSCKYASLN